MTNKKQISQIDAEYGVDARYRNDVEKAEDAILLMEARLNRMKNLSKEQIMRAKLMQLKLKMENYLNEWNDNNQNQFSDFLKLYIDALYPKRIDFAKDVNISANYLSKIINNHRAPNEDFILRLMVHSEKVFKQVGAFQKKIWYQIYLHKKLSDTMSNQDKWLPEIEKQIHVKDWV